MLLETYMSTQAMFQTVALVDGATVDMTLPIVDEVAETVSLLNPAPGVTVQQWLITSRGRLKYEYSQTPVSVVHQPSIPGATFETVVRAFAWSTKIVVIDPTVATAAYQLDLADVFPSAMGTFTTDISELRWHDEGQRPVDFAVGQGAGWTLIAPVEYRDTDAVLRVPTLPGFNATPRLDAVITFTDGETYDAARPHVAEYLLGLSSELDLSDIDEHDKSTPSRRIIAQTIFNCEGSQDCE